MAALLVLGVLLWRRGTPEPPAPESAPPSPPEASLPPPAAPALPAALVSSPPEAAPSDDVTSPDEIPVLVSSEEPPLPIGAAQVSLRGIGADGAVFATCTTDEDGRCTLTLDASPERLVLQATAEGHLPGRVTVWRPFRAPMATVVLRAERRLRGLVLDGSTEAPVANAIVEAENGARTRTDDRGRFALSGHEDHPRPEYGLVDPRRSSVQRLRVAAEGYATAELDPVACQAACTVRLQPRVRRLFGVVQSEVGAPRAGVGVFEADVRSSLRRATSGADGRFVLLAANECARVRLAGPGLRTTLCEVCTFEGLEDQVTPCVVPEGGRIEGAVVDPDGHAVSAARVRLVGPDDFEAEARTDADGRFEISGTPVTGASEVTITALDWARLRVREAPPTGTRTYRLSRGARLTLNVVRGDSGRSPGRLVWIHEGPWRRSRGVTFDGRVRLQALSPGTHTVLLRNVDVIARTVEVELAAGEPRTVDVVVEPAGSLRVVLPDGLRAVRVRAGAIEGRVAEGQGYLFGVPLGPSRVELLDVEGRVIDTRTLEIGAGDNTLEWSATK